MKFEQARINARAQARKNYERNVINNAIKAANNVLGNQSLDAVENVDQAYKGGYLLGGPVVGVIAREMARISQDTQSYNVKDFLPEGFTSMYYNNALRDADDGIRTASLDMQNFVDPNIEAIGIEMLGLAVSGKAFEPLIDYSDLTDWWEEAGDWWTDKKFDRLDRKWGSYLEGSEGEWYPGKNIDMRNLLRRSDEGSLVEGGSLWDVA